MEDLDKFKPRRPDRKKLEEGFDISKIQHVTSQVVQFLMTKALHEKRKQDKFNPTVLGRVSFYMDYNDMTKETRLMFDKHPNTWDQNEIIRDLNNLEADIMMEKQADQDIYEMDNPFRF